MWTQIFWIVDILLVVFLIVVLYLYFDTLRAYYAIYPEYDKKTIRKAYRNLLKQLEKLSWSELLTLSKGRARGMFDRELNKLL